MTLREVSPVESTGLSCGHLTGQSCKEYRITTGFPCSEVPDPPVWSTGFSGNFCHFSQDNPVRLHRTAQHLSRCFPVCQTLCFRDNDNDVLLEIVHYQVHTRPKTHEHCIGYAFAALSLRPIVNEPLSGVTNTDQPQQWTKRKYHTCLSCSTTFSSAAESSGAKDEGQSNCSCRAQAKRPVGSIGWKWHFEG